MYCPSCGTEIAQRLKYCNRCGANLFPDGIASLHRLSALVWTIPLAMALVTLGGLGMIFYTGLELIRAGANNSLTAVGMITLDLVAVIVIDWMLIRQLSRVISLQRSANETVVQLQQPESNEAQRPEFHAQREPFLVTEQTTRSFSPTLREQ